MLMMPELSIVNYLSSTAIYIFIYVCIYRLIQIFILTIFIYSFIHLFIFASQTITTTQRHEKEVILKKSPNNKLFDIAIFT